MQLEVGGGRGWRPHVHSPRPALSPPDASGPGSVAKWWFGPVDQPSPGSVLFPPVTGCRGCTLCLGAFWLRACVSWHACARGLSGQVYCGGALGAGTSGRAGTGTIYVIPAAPLVAYFNTSLVSAW